MVSLSCYSMSSGVHAFSVDKPWILLDLVRGSGRCSFKMILWYPLLTNMVFIPGLEPQTGCPFWKCNSNKLSERIFDLADKKCLSWGCKMGIWPPKMGHKLGISFCIYIHTYITLHYITLHYITLHYITLHYITLHYITLHYITLHTYTQTCMYIHEIMYIGIYGRTMLAGGFVSGMSNFQAQLNVR